MLAATALMQDIEVSGQLWLSSVNGEVKTWGGDKSRGFVDLFNRLTASLPYPVVACTPTADETKADLVRWWLDQNLSLAQLVKTYSCHRGGDLHCGLCQACFRRWTAFATNGVERDLQWENNPRGSLDDPIVQKKLAEMRRVVERGYRLVTESATLRDARQVLAVVDVF
jgi:7-cyano-7-deazaguanine synthase in queuosine biosynthesis